MSTAVTTRAIAAVAIAAIASCAGSGRSPERPTPATVSMPDLEARGVRSIDALVELAGDSEHPLRADAIRALGRLGDDRAVAALIEIGSDPDSGVRARVATALGIARLMGASGSAVAAGLASRWGVEREPEVKAALAIALGRSGDASSVAPLVAGLADSRAEVVGASALALGLLGRAKIAISDRARRSLAELATGRPHRYAAVYALAREHQPAVDAVVLRVLEALATAPDPEIRTQAITGLSRRRHGRDRLVSALDDRDWRVAAAAVSGLAELKSDAATRDLAGWIREIEPTRTSPMVIRAALRVLLERADLPVARSAARALGNKVRAEPPSLDRAQIDCLARAVEARRQRNLAGFRGCGERAPAWWRRSLEAEVLATHQMSAARRLVALAALLADSDPRVRAAAVSAVVKLAPDTAVRRQVIKAITAALGDSSAAVAGTAVDSIAGLSLEGGEIGPVFTAVIDRGGREIEGDAELGLTFINAIAASKIAIGEPLCRSAHRHRNREARRAGRACLQALGGADPGPGVPDRAADLPHRPVERGTLRWVVETSRGTVTIELDADRAPWHVAAIAGLTREKRYDGLLFHRVVPGFVTQGGDPSGTGWGGPGFVLPPEPTDTPYDRGVVGIADAGPGTGGSQWFVMHARAPHLEGRYTVIGRVTGGLAIFDALAVGDRIVKATIAR